MPTEMSFDNLLIEDDKAIICFTYKENKIYFTQRKKEEDAILSLGSDRERCGVIKNAWLDKEIEYGKNELSDGTEELEAKFAIENTAYYLFGKMEQEEFKKIVENLYFY